MTRIPKHIGIIPDGNRRWAQGKGFAKEDGYAHGSPPAWSSIISAGIWE